MAGILNCTLLVFQSLVLHVLLCSHLSALAYEKSWVVIIDSWFPWSYKVKNTHNTYVSVSPWYIWEGSNKSLDLSSWTTSDLLIHRCISWNLRCFHRRTGAWDTINNLEAIFIPIGGSVMLPDSAQILSDRFCDRNRAGLSHSYLKK